MNEWAMVAIGLLLTVGTGLFVASEFALVNLDRADLERRQQRGERSLGPTIRALRITSTHLSGAQLGITLTTLLTGYTFEPAISSLLERPLTGAGVPAGAVSVVGTVIGVVLATLFSMVIGELVPKNFALALPLATAKIVVPFQAVFTAVFKPVIVLLNGTANALIRRVGIEPKEELSGARSADELSYLIRHSATAGLLQQADATLLGRTLRFSRRDAADVMTPRVRMASVQRTDRAETVIALSQATGHSRFPVIEGTPDRITGFVHVKQAFAVDLQRRTTTTVEQLQSSVLRVPETIGVDTLLGLLRREGLQIAVVTDEHGGTAGIVTLEDLIEEIVGELEDEHDRQRTGFTRRGRSVVFDAGWRPDELQDRLGIAVPEDGDYETLGGFVTAQLDRMPELGDEVGLPGAGIAAPGVLRVDRIDGARIVRLRWTPEDDAEPALTGRHDRVVAALGKDLTDE